MTMNRIALVVFHRTERVYWFADNIKDAAERSLANRHRDRTASVAGFHAAHHPVGRLHRKSAHAAFTEMLLHFGNYIDRNRHIESVREDSQRLVNRRQVVSLKLDVENGPDNLHNFADMTIGARVRRRHTPPIKA